MDSEFVEWMYELLDLYNEPYDSRQPVIGVDKKTERLHEDSRKPIPVLLNPGVQE